jgi:hypothetical protein
MRDMATTAETEETTTFLLTYLGEIIDAGDSIRSMSESRESIWKLIAADESAWWDSGDFEDKADFIEQFKITAT